MENEIFSKALIRVIVAASVCDGEIHPKEIAKIKNICAEEYYLNGTQSDSFINEMLEEAQIRIQSFSEEAIKLVSNMDISPVHKLIMINTAIAVVRADHKMHSSEINFIEKLILHLKVPRDIVEAANEKWWILNTGPIE